MIFIVIAIILLAIIYRLVIVYRKPATVPIPAPPAGEEKIRALVLVCLAKGIPPTQCNVNGFLPKKGESIIWAFEGVKHLQQGTHSEWVGRSAGVSTRVFKGVWIRSGQSAGQRVQHQSMDYRGRGTLVFTTKGFTFLADNSTNIPLARILACKMYRDGIGLNTDYARNNSHIFCNLHSDHVGFIKTALDIMSGNLNILDKTNPELKRGSLTVPPDSVPFAMLIAVRDFKG
jgi:hypothetical protein